MLLMENFNLKVEIEIQIPLKTESKMLFSGQCFLRVLIVLFSTRSIAKLSSFLVKVYLGLY